MSNTHGRQSEERYAHYGARCRDQLPDPRFRHSITVADSAQRNLQRARTVLSFSAKKCTEHKNYAALAMPVTARGRPAHTSYFLAVHRKINYKHSLVAQNLSPSLSVCLSLSLPLPLSLSVNKLRERPPQYAPAPCKFTFDLESGVRVTCDVGYLSVPISVFLGPPLCSRLRPDVGERKTEARQTDIRRASTLNAPYHRGGA